jgi:hypothetical protein
MTTDQEITPGPGGRGGLEDVASPGGHAAGSVLPAPALLAGDNGREGGGGTDARISREPDVTERIVRSIKKRFLAKGVPPAGRLAKKPDGRGRLKREAAFKKKPAEPAGTPPPRGKPRWSARLSSLPGQASRPPVADAPTVQAWKSPKIRQNIFTRLNCFEVVVQKYRRRPVN